MSLEGLHAQFRNMHAAALKKVANFLQMEFKTTTMRTCEACAKAKAQQKTFSKLDKHTPQQTLELGERCIYLDIAQLN